MLSVTTPQRPNHLAVPANGRPHSPSLVVVLPIRCDAGRIADDLLGAVGHVFELFGQQRVVAQVGDSTVKGHVGTPEPAEIVKTREFRLARDVLVEFLKVIRTQPLTRETRRLGLQQGTILGDLSSGLDRHCLNERPMTWAVDDQTAPPQQLESVADGDARHIKLPSELKLRNRCAWFNVPIDDRVRQHLSDGFGHRWAAANQGQVRALKARRAAAGKLWPVDF